ncbi:unnamed protein product [Absidia cylindrospora]
MANSESKPEQAFISPSDYLDCSECVTFTGSAFWITMSGLQLNDNSPMNTTRLSCPLILHSRSSSRLLQVRKRLQVSVKCSPCFDIIYAWGWLWWKQQNAVAAKEFVEHYQTCLCQSVDMIEQQAQQ